MAIESRPNPVEQRRHRLTLDFVKASLPAGSSILDLGADNGLARAMRAEGYTVLNTDGDLDDHPEVAARPDVDAVTGFEILEHLVSPYPLLRSIRADRLFVSVPLRLWFASAYRNPTDPWDRHFHEFEAWQFDWLLDKSGWDIVRSRQWISPARRLGVRPLLRRFTPRHYIVEAVRRSQP